MSDPRRTLPGVDVLLDAPEVAPLLAVHPRARVLRAARELLESVREAIGRDGAAAVPDGMPAYAAALERTLESWATPSLRPVINATGVILHTNLGRAPLSEATRTAMAHAGAGYSNLEFDLDGGGRGSRYVHCVELLKEITGAPEALVVNNNAAAVVLALNTMAMGREVLVSRGELVEIGGGFRIPDMISRSGAVLREVGTTNRTRLADYREAADGGNAAAILKVHRSNFRISGFTEETEIRELAELAREKGLFLFHDLGSGLLADPGTLGLPPEPRAPESLRDGAHAVAISGDKLLGGPQAGIILGEGPPIQEMRRSPLTRAFRVDKVTLAGLEATLRHYLSPAEALREVPTLRMLALTPDEMETRTRSLAEQLASPGLMAEVQSGFGVVGGGTFPGVELPGWTLKVKVNGVSPQMAAQRLRDSHPPIVARREDDLLVLDLRTVEPKDDARVVEALGSLVPGPVDQSDAPRLAGEGDPTGDE